MTQVREGKRGPLSSIRLSSAIIYTVSPSKSPSPSAVNGRPCSSVRVYTVQKESVCYMGGFSHTGEEEKGEGEGRLLRQGEGEGRGALLM